MDLYFQGKIKKQLKILSGSSYTGIKTPTVKRSSANFDINPEIFPNSGKIQVKWHADSPTFSPVGGKTSQGYYYLYIYEGDNISFTTNWNTESINSAIANPSTSSTINGPTEAKVDELNEVPTIYCNWKVKWGYEWQNCPCDTVDEICDIYGCGGYGCSSYNCDCDSGDSCDCDSGDSCDCDSGDGGYGTITVTGVRYVGGIKGRDGTEMYYNGSWTQGGEVFIPEGTYTIVYKDEYWTIFDFVDIYGNSRYAKIP